MKVLISYLAALLVLTSCATAPVPAANAHSVPADRLLASYSTFASPSTDAVQVTVIRDSGMLGAAVAAKLSIDGTDIARIRNRERVDIYLKPGSYIFGVVPSPQGFGALIEESYNIQAGKHHYFRISVPVGGSFAIQPSARLD